MTTRKRYRNSVVCGFCKKRKVKCDKGSPCSTCVKYGNTNCNYATLKDRSFIESPNHKYVPDENNTTMEELFQLKSKVRRMEQAMKRTDQTIWSHGHIQDKSNPNETLSSSDFNESESINFYEGYTSIYDNEPTRMRNFGPFSWLALMKIDPALFKLWLHLHNMTQERKKQKSGGAVEEDVTIKRNSDRKSKLKNMLPRGKSNLKKDFPDVFTSKNENSNITENDESLRDSHLVRKIATMIPDRKSLTLLVERFFTHVYPFFPFIDETRFGDGVMRLIEWEEKYNSGSPKLNVTTALDVAELGLILVVLRFSYLSFPSSSTDVPKNFDDYGEVQNENESSVKHIKPIDSSIIDVAKECLDNFDLFGDINMIILQLTLYIRLYHIFSPEAADGIDGGDSQVFNAMTMQMAYSMGLNREPDYFPDQCNDEKSNNLGRKIWYYLLSLDVNNTIPSGIRLSASRSSFDTKPPFYKEGNENISDSELEKKIITSVSWFDKLYDHLSELLELVLNLRKDIIVGELHEKMEFLESNIIQEEADLNRILNENQEKDYQFYNVLSIKVNSTFSFFLVSIYFYLFNHFEDKGDFGSSFSYLRKILDLCLSKLMPFCIELLERRGTLFKDSTEIVLIPSLESLIHRSFLISISVVIRLNTEIHQHETSKEHKIRLLDDKQYMNYLNKLRAVSKDLESCCWIFVEAMRSLSKTYCFASTMSKAQQIMMKVITSFDFNFSGIMEGHDRKVHFTLPMLEEIADLLKAPLEKVRQVGSASMKRILNSKMHSLAFTSEETRIDSIYKEELARPLDKFERERADFGTVSPPSTISTPEITSGSSETVRVDMNGIINSLDGTSNYLNDELDYSGMFSYQQMCSNAYNFLNSVDFVSNSDSKDNVHEDFSKWSNL